MQTTTLLLGLLAAAVQARNFTSLTDMRNNPSFTPVNASAIDTSILPPGTTPLTSIPTIDWAHDNYFTELAELYPGCARECATSFFSVYQGHCLTFIAVEHRNATLSCICQNNFDISIGGDKSGDKTMTKGYYKAMDPCLESQCSGKDLDEAKVVGKKYEDWCQRQPKVDNIIATYKGEIKLSGASELKVGSGAAAVVFVASAIALFGGI